MIISGITINGLTVVDIATIGSTTSTTTPTTTANVSIGTANGSPFSTSVNSYTISSQPANAPYNYVSVPGGTGFAFGTGDFCIEWFQYLITSQTNQRAFWYGTSPSIGVSQEGAVSSKTIYAWIGASPTTQGGVALTEKVWQHHALVRISNRSYYYINGNVINPGGTSFTANITDTTSTFYIMSKSNSGIQNEQFLGSMTSFRVIKGNGVYTGNFKVPTSPLGQTQGANPYGGANTSAITSGQCSLLLNP